MNENPEWLNKIATLPEINTNIKLFGGHKQRVDYPWVAERETHFSFEVMIILSGVQHTEFSGRSYDFSEGSIILIPPGTSHENSCGSKDGLKYFCAHFDIDDPSIQQTFLMYCPILLRKENKAYQDIQHVLQTYVTLLDQDSFDLKQKLVVEKLLIELVIALLDYANYEQIKMASSDNSTLVLAKAIADTIQQNFRKFTKNPMDENRHLLSMHYVASILNISESTMLKILKKVYGVSPKRYLDQLRYNESKFLLHQPNLSISEIAEVVGYQNLSHFSRQFKTWGDVSPNEYRQMTLKNPNDN